MSVDDTITTVTERGQVSIPAVLRRRLGLVPGHKLLWEADGDKGLRLRVVEDQLAVGAEAMLGFARRFREEPRRTAEWMAELRAGEKP